MSSPGNNSSLRPSWYKGSGSGGGKGFQPPPTATDRGDKGRSPSVGSAGESRRDSNKFAALLDDDDVVVGNGVELSSSPKPPPSSNSRSEAFRSSFNRSSSSGAKATGRSLADLAAKAPESSSTGRRHSSYAEGGRAGSGRFSSLRAGDAAAGGSIDSYKPDPKVIRYTREKLLSLRPGTRGEDPGPPDVLKPLEGSVVLSPTAQDPVCWDTFDAESIWETVRERRSSALGTKPGLEGDPRRRNAPSSGRWSRGLALPPQEEAARRKERDAENPNELWDDPMGGATGAAADFSAFGAMPSDDGDNVFDFDKMAEASRKLEEEIHGVKHGDDDSSEQHVAKKVDVSRPLASAGTTLVSGSGDDVNVFEDFDAPSEPAAGEKETKANGPSETPSVRGGDEDPSASSRLMKMIGVSRDANEPTGLSEDAVNNPWGSDPVKSNSAVDPIIGAIGGGSISLNPWGGPSQQGGGMNLGIGLGGAFGADAKNRDTQMAAEREKIAQREAEVLRRRQEEEQRRSMAEQKARQQQASMQQQTSQQSQIELVLMERICVILENSWGRSDLPSILTTLHSEDSRVIPLVSNVDSLRALIARSAQRVALRRDPGFGGEMAALLITNSQWQQQEQQRQQQAQLQQEELRRRRQMEEAANRAQAQNRLAASINHDAPWFYSDPQNNIQGPFRGEEMRQWLEAGYFKGDLPISQVASGPFHPLSVWFPNLHYAFQQQPTNGKTEDQAVADGKSKAEGLQRETEAAERERRAAEEAQAAAAQREAQEKEAAEMEAERQKQAEAASSSEGGVNESSNQLKMMLGLAAGAQPGGEDEPEKAEPTTTSKTARAENQAKAATKKTPQKVVEEAPVPAPPAAAPAAPAWGGAANSKQARKSMSEIQQEEARAAAMLAAKRGSMPQSSSGWANVAAGTTGWSSGAIRQGPATQNPAAAAGVRPSQARPKPQAATVQGAANRNVAPLTQQQRASSTASSTPAEEFGTSMSPALEKWCKEKMVQINGSDDLTLVGFCMTLNDANEIRQYLVTYLGSTQPVNSFATEFINKRGLGSKQEEWETPGSAKKGRKKKAGR